MTRSIEEDKELETVSELITQWKYEWPFVKGTMDLMKFCESASPESVLKVWEEASSRVNDPKRRISAEEGDDEAQEIISQANRLRVHILQERQDISHLLPRDDNYRMPPGI